MIARSKLSGILIILFLFTPALAEVTSSFWQTEKSQHFIINYQQAPASFVSDLVSTAESYYNSIVDELGYRRMDFWSWDNRAKIYLYQNTEDFHKDPRHTSWSQAIVSVNNRTIESYVGQEDFLDSILPHELTHIIFREFVGMRVILPLAIDEGVASSQEKSNLNTRLRIAGNLSLQNNYIKFDKFFEIYKIGDIDPRLFYAQSASIIVFLINDYDREHFLDFSRKLRDGIGWKDALFSVYRFNSFDEMEQAWKDYMIKRE